MRGVQTGAAVVIFVGLVALISWAIMGSVLPGLIVFIPAAVVGLLLSAAAS